MAKARRGASPGAEATPPSTTERRNSGAVEALPGDAATTNGCGEAAAMRFLEAFPKGMLCDLLGVHQKVMLEKSRLFGLGYHTSGTTCQPLEMLQRLIAWTTEHKHGISRLLRSETLEESLSEDGESFDVWQLALIKERTLDIREKREERQRRVVDREVLVDLLRETFVEPMAQKQEQLDRRTGEVPVEEARAWFDEMLSNIERSIETLIDTEAGDDNDG